MVCYGKGCHVTFSNVSFGRCTLIVLAGAHATASACSFDATSLGDVVVYSRAPTPGHPPISVALVASGCDSCVQMHDCQITGCKLGIAVRAGAKVMATHLQLEEMTSLGAHELGTGSEVHLISCSIRYTAVHAKARGFGVCAKDGCVVCLKKECGEEH